MQPLTQQYVDQCPVEDGFHMRGMAMTRIEVFTDAAFAFAVTMLVISIDQIPRSIPELVAISKYIPAFVLSVAQMVFIWHNHSVWSRRFGLEDSKTVFLSVALVITVLVYIYPLKMMFEGFFSWISMGYLPSQYDLNNYAELRLLFYYFAAGFLIICLLFIAMYRHALNLRTQLLLRESEIYQTQTNIKIRTVMAGVCVLAFIAPALVPDSWVPFTGTIYALIWPLVAWTEKTRYQQWQQMNLGS
ncbi:TMEM175 family protein [Marinicella sediminis]|uniref:TMEM175 family protein n=1 Tax=Marinicella sediminis TaxID=1792834 RepID=A0ABV7JIA8_9GAMM